MILTRSAAAAALNAFTTQKATEEEARARAAVCLLIVPDGDSTAVVLTRRATTLRTHKGQWAFPGGRVDAGETANEAALRELDEELGVTLTGDRVLGELDDYVTRSGYCITPVVVWAGHQRFEPVPHEAEVASVHVIPMRDIDVEPQFIAIEESPRPVIKVPILGS